MHAAAGRRRRGAEVEARAAGPVRDRLRAGRKTACVSVIAPPLMSPPTRLRLCASSASGPSALRARIRSRNPGAKRSTCASIALGRVAGPSRSARGSTPRPCACPRARGCRRRGSAARAGRTGARAGGPPTARAPRRRARPACRRGGRSPARRHASAVHGIGPSSAQSSLKARRPVPVAAEVARVAGREPAAAEPQQLARRDVGEHDAAPPGPRRPATPSWIVAAELAQVRGQGVGERLRAAAGDRPAVDVPEGHQARARRRRVGRRSSGRIECAALPAKSARARSCGRLRSARPRALDEGGAHGGERRREGRRRLPGALCREATAARPARAAPVRPRPSRRRAGRPAGGRPPRRRRAAPRSRRRRARA